MSGLTRCPACGHQPEFHWRDYTFGACSGALRCPFSHIRVQQGYFAGSQAKAKTLLIEQWERAVSEYQGGKDGI